MTYTKEIALSDEIHIDGTDMSDAFSSFTMSTEREQVDVGGFNATGVDEYLVGKLTETFSGTMFYTPEVYAVLWDLYSNKTIFTVVWKPEGLADPTRESFSADCQLLNFAPEGTFGDARTMQVTFTVNDSNGIQSSASS